MQQSQPSIIKLDKMLVLLICIGQYDSDTLWNLPGTQTDKQRLHQLFTDIYGYKVISNKSPYVTEDDMDDILLRAKKEFRRTDINYNGIMVFYSGPWWYHNTHII